MCVEPPRSRRACLESPGRSPAPHCSPLLPHSFSTLGLLCPFWSLSLSLSLRMLSRSPHHSSVSLGHLPSLTPLSVIVTPLPNSHGFLSNVASALGCLCSQVCLPLNCPCYPSPLPQLECLSLFSHSFFSLSPFSHPDGSFSKPLGAAEDLGTSKHPQGARRASAACPASPCPTPGSAAPAPGCIKWRRRRRRRVAPWARAVPSMPGG